MSLRAILLCLLLLSVLPIIGCGGNNEPVNEGKDRPIPPPKKDEDKKP